MECHMEREGVRLSWVEGTNYGAVMYEVSIMGKGV